MHMGLCELGNWGMIGERWGGEEEGILGSISGPRFYNCIMRMMHQST